MNKKKFSAGFTLIELTLVMGIMSVLLTITTILLTGLIPKASQVSSTDVLRADLRQQQSKAMVGETDGAMTQQTYGVKIDPHQYTLFRSTYGVGKPDNFVVTIDAPLQLSTTFPSQQVTFLKGSGEVQNFSKTTDTITITNVQSGDNTILELNKYGVIQ